MFKVGVRYVDEKKRRQVSNAVRRELAAGNGVVGIDQQDIEAIVAKQVGLFFILLLWRVCFWKLIANDEEKKSLEFRYILWWTKIFLMQFISILIYMFVFFFFFCIFVHVPSQNSSIFIL